MYYFSAKTGGFYTRQSHGSAIPDDAVSVSAAQHQSLMKGQESGKRIVSDGNGFPVLADQIPMTVDQLSDVVRSNRDKLLRASDFSQLPDAPVNKQAWATYRQALRDVPEQSSFPQSVAWPVAPKD